MKRQALLALALALWGCSSPSGPQSGSQTNWLRVCDTSDDCGGLECICGACTASCESDVACTELTGSSCVGSTDEGSIALCGGQAPPSNLCLPLCDDASCPRGTSCVAGVCTPTGGATARMTIDVGVRHQSLVGFGSSLAYAEDVIVEHSHKEALFDLVFADSGLDAIRLGNRYQDGTELGLAPSSEIVAAVTERLGRTPFLFMTSGTPPVALKANGSRTCAGDADTCTLISLPGGGFDYPGFAAYWRDGLEAYAAVGIEPDYISIQNVPNWVPPAEARLDACFFLPEEGTSTVTVDDAPLEVAYPGYREALAAVTTAIADLPNVPRIGLPETGFVGVSDYLPLLDASTFDAIAFHLYGADPAAIDVAQLEGVRDRAEQLDRPVFQTEMRAEGLETAILVHHALTAGGASAYFQNDLVSWTTDEAPLALAYLGEDGVELQGPYYALSHFAKSTDPGWVRVEATSDSSELLGSAWLSPDEGALTVVLVNPGSEELRAELVLPAELRATFGRSEVTRTVFEALERTAALGELPSDGIVQVPGGSIVTVALTSD